MRLNQLAKKVGKPYTRVEKFLIKDCGLEDVDGPNTKVSEEIIEKVIYKFGLAEDNKTEGVKKVVLKTVEAVAAEIKPEEKGIEEADITLKKPTPAEAVKPVIKLEDVQTTNVETPTIETTDSTEEPVIPEVEVTSEVAAVEESIKEEENITTVETGETTLHIDDDGVIKAPKVELDGIKVMGKIDLPQPKIVEEEEKEEIETTVDSTEEAPAPVAEKPKKPKKKGPSQEELDDRRAKRIAAKKQAEREAFEKENAALKAKEKEAKKLHYANQKKSAPKLNKKKKSNKSAQVAEENKAFDTKEKYQNTENLTTYQKIVRWFNT